MTGFMSVKGTAKLSLFSESQATNFFIISSAEVAGERIRSYIKILYKL
jgi:hypothetical protein